MAAHGMIWVPPGYSFGEAAFGLDEVRGGSGWGAGTFAGPTGARQPTQTELAQAEHQVTNLLSRHRSHWNFDSTLYLDGLPTQCQLFLAVDAAALHETQR